MKGPLLGGLLKRVNVITIKSVKQEVNFMVKKIVDQILQENLGKNMSDKSDLNDYFWSDNLYME